MTFWLRMRWVLLAQIFSLPIAINAAETVIPQVTITKPSNGGVLTGRQIVEVAASDDSGITNVLLKVDGAPNGPALQAGPYRFTIDTTKLSTGVHTLHAVASDGAGNTGTSSILTVSITNAPRYELATGPFAPENLGTVLSMNTQERQVFFRHNGEDNLLLYFYSGENPLQILHVNLSRGTTRLTNTPFAGRPGVRGTVLYNNGNIYHTITGCPDGFGYFIEYNITTGTTRTIARTTGSSGGQYSEIGDDGWIYIGGYPNAFVDRYNPNTGDYQRLGNMDQNADYAYTLGADSRYLYVGLGNPWSLAVYDTQTKTTNAFWSTNLDTYGAVRHGTNGAWYYQRTGPATNMRTVWYALSNGIPTLLSSTPNDLYIENAQRANVVDNLSNANLLGYEVDLDSANPTSVSPSATVRYRLLQEANWRSASAVGFNLSPASISRVYSWDDSRLLVFTSAYGPACVWDVGTRQTSILGYTQCNLYNAIVSDTVAYFSGYDAVTLCYNRSKPWTLSASTPNRFATSSNPHQITPVLRTHNYFSTFGCDGMVYVGSHIDRNGTGSTLGWWDPTKGTSGTLAANLSQVTIGDLQPALGGSKLVYVTAGTSPSPGTNLLVFDVVTKSIQHTINPLGSTTLDKVIEISPGIVFGVAGSNVFKVDVTSGTLLSRTVLPGSAFAESIGMPHRRLILGPDNHIWMFRWHRDAQNFNRSALYRINPIDYSYTVILDNTFYTYGEKSPMFHGKDLYLFGGSDLLRVPNVLRSLATPTEVRILGTTSL